MTVEHKVTLKVTKYRYKHFDVTTLWGNEVVYCSPVSREVYSRMCCLNYTR